MANENDSQIERIVTPSRKEWLAARRRDVTASQIAALVADCHPYCTRYRLFAEKTGALVPDDDIDSAVLKRGRKLEKLAVEEATEQLPPETTLEHNTDNTYWRDPRARIGATPDLIIKNNRGLGVVQIKCPEPSIYLRTWINGEPPLWIALQALTEAQLIGAQFAYVGALRVGFSVDFTLTEIPLHAGAWARLREAVAEFWRSVEAGVPPLPNYDRDSAVISALNRDSTDSTIDLSGDNELIAALVDREEAKTQAKALEAVIDRADAMIRHKAGPHETILAGGYRVTLKTQQVSGYTVQPRLQRPIRQKRLREAAA